MPRLVLTTKIAGGRFDRDIGVTIEHAGETLEIQAIELQSGSHGGRKQVRLMFTAPASFRILRAHGSDAPLPKTKPEDSHD